MTRRTAPAVEPIPALTGAGAGLIIPVAKAYGHLTGAQMAAALEWPITQSHAATELAEANRHSNDINAPDPLVTEELRTAIDDWRTNISTLETSLTQSARENGDEPLTDEQKSTVRDAMRQTWDLLTRIDREITGIPMADPGTTP